jgi:hypothetical protein
VSSIVLIDDGGFLWPFSLYGGACLRRQERSFFMDKIDANQAKDCVKRGILFGYVPHPLSIPGRHELDVFSLNVLFTRYKVKDDKTIIGSTLYEPDLDFYTKENSIATLEYHNKYGGNSWLTIRYDESEKSYHGKKFVEGVMVGEAFGKNGIFFPPFHDAWFI